MIALLIIASLNTPAVIPQAVNESPENKREWFFAKSGFENHYAQHRGKRKLYFDGAMFEGTLDQEYWLQIALYRTREYVLDQKSTDVDLPENLSFFGDIPDIHVEEETKRRDMLLIGQMLYSFKDWRWQPTSCDSDNCLIEANLRFGFGLSTFGHNDVRRYSLHYEKDRPRSIQNPIDRTFTKSYLFASFSPFLRLGLARVQFDLQYDFSHKWERAFVSDIRGVITWGAQF